MSAAPIWRDPVLQALLWLSLATIAWFLYWPAGVHLQVQVLWVLQVPLDVALCVLAFRVRSAAVAGAARRCGKLVDQAVADRLVEAGEGLALVLEDLPPGRWDSLPQAAAGALSAVRDAAGACRTAARPRPPTTTSAPPSPRR